MGARARVERAQHPDPVLLDAQVLQHPKVVAREGHHQVGREVIVVDLGGAMVGGIAVGLEHPGGPLVGAAADVPVAGARAGHPYRVTQAAPAQLIGEHLLGHHRTADVPGADEGDVQRLSVRHPAPPQLVDRRGVRHPGGAEPSAKSSRP